MKVWWSRTLSTPDLWSDLLDTDSTCRLCQEHNTVMFVTATSCDCHTVISVTVQTCKFTSTWAEPQLCLLLSLSFDDIVNQTDLLKVQTHTVLIHSANTRTLTPTHTHPCAFVSARTFKDLIQSPAPNLRPMTSWPLTLNPDLDLNPKHNLKTRSKPSNTLL